MWGLFLAHTVFEKYLKGTDIHLKHGESFIYTVKPLLGPKRRLFAFGNSGEGFDRKGTYHGERIHKVNKNGYRWQLFSSIIPYFAEPTDYFASQIRPFLCQTISKLTSAVV